MKVQSLVPMLSLGALTVGLSSLLTARAGTGYTLTREESDLSRVDKVRFTKLGELWVPVEAADGLDSVFATLQKVHRPSRHGARQWRVCKRASA